MMATFHYRAPRLASARVSDRWRADRSFQVKEAECARKNRHHSTNVITWSAVKPERRPRGSATREERWLYRCTRDSIRENRGKLHTHTKIIKKSPNKSSRDARAARMEAKRDVFFKKTKKTQQAHGSKQETEYRTTNVTNSTQIWVICINGCSGTTARRVPTLITWPCKTTHTKSGNNDDKPSGKWTRTVQQEITCRRYPPSLCLHDKSSPAVNILRIIELIVICSFSVWM